MNLLKLIIFFITLPSNVLLAMEGGHAFPKIYSLEFQKDKIGLVFDIDKTSKQRVANDNTLRFGIYEDNKMKIISLKDFKTQFPTIKKVNGFSEDYETKKNFKDNDGKNYEVKYSNCKDQEEGDSVCTKIEIVFEKESILLDFKDEQKNRGKITNLNRWGNNLLASFAHYGESGPYGRGVAVIDVNTKKITRFIYDERSFKVKLDDSRSLATIIKKDPSKEIMWIGGSYGLYGYDFNLNLVHTCNLLVSYIDFDKKEMEIFKDRLEFTCDK